MATFLEYIKSLPPDQKADVARQVRESAAQQDVPVNVLISGNNWPDPVPAPTGGSAQQNADGTVTTTNADGTQTTVDQPVLDNTTNPSISDTARASKNLTGGISGGALIGLGALVGGTRGAAVGAVVAGAVNSLGKLSTLSKKKPSANPNNSIPSPAQPKFKGADTQRVRLLVPDSYINNNGPASNLYSLGGILFPFTPQISIDHSASYTTMNAMHSNYTQYFYKNSNISEITISGKFVVQSDQDAAYLISTIHLGRSLVKMKFGLDEDRGAPPPVCRLNAHGDYIFNNTPVVVKSFSSEFPDNVDYYTLDTTTSILRFKNLGISSVPVISTIKMTLLPVYSRQQQLNSSVTGWLDGYSGGNRTQGFL